MSDCGGYETLSTWQRERDSGLVKELWLAEGDGIANCYQRIRLSAPAFRHGDESRVPEGPRPYQSVPV
jgi:hypothetical protein